MDYNNAHNFIFNEIGEESTLLLIYISGDKQMEAIELIMKLTHCEHHVAKAIWVDLKNEYGTSETNPFVSDEKNSVDYAECLLSYKTNNINKPKCPICQSINLSKITVTKKAVKIGLFGIFGAMNDAGKTWKCNECGSKF